MLPAPKEAVKQASATAWTLLDEFKAFAFKGNVVDLTIGVIIGGAFHTIIDSFVKNLFTPLMAILIPGDRPFTHWEYNARGITVHIGTFLADVVHFLLIAAILFLFLVKFLGWLMRTHKADDATPVLSREEELLSEIRDLLKEQQDRAA